MSPWALWPCGHMVATRADVADHACEKWAPSPIRCCGQGDAETCIPPCFRMGAEEYPTSEEPR